jgi:hypothetical protein
MVRPKSPPAEIRDIMLSFRVSAGMKAAVDIAANSRNMTVTDWLLEVVQGGLTQHQLSQLGQVPVQ